MISHDVSASFDNTPRGAHATLEQAIEFLNTTGLSKGRPFEELATSGLAVHWLAHMDVLNGPDAVREQARFAASPADASAALDRLRTTRAGLREVIDAIAEARAPSPDALAAVNAALEIAEVAELVADGTSLRVVHRRDGEPFDQALAALVRAIVDEISEGRLERFRVCENDRCRWAFYDRSRPGTRRWCDMSSCGNRMKAARHRARQRQAPSGAAEPEPGA